MKFNRNLLLGLIILSAFLLRLIPLNFPSFTTDEARIAFRGYVLSINGVDELGRKFPYLFNSLNDYQLPLVSYISASGAMLFGKSDLGARIPFILVGSALVFLVYKISQVFSTKKEVWLLSAFITAFSPVLIFLSKVPNESILLTFLLTSLFYFLTKEKVNLKIVFTIIILLFFTSKFAWFITPSFVIFTLLFYQNNLLKNVKINLSIFCVLLSFITIGFFLYIPQGSRSLLENNFPIFSDVTIKNGINRLRGQGMEAGWPNFLERILFNRSQVIFVGFLNWMYNLGPAILFGQFDETGTNGFIGMGEFSKIAIIPFVSGLIFIIRKGEKKLKTLIFYLLILTFPLFFIYPNAHQEILVPALPFLVLITALGLVRLNHPIRYVTFFLIIFEVSINIIFLSPQIKNTNYSRPVWIKVMVEDSYNLSVGNKVAISDDLTKDIVPFLEWYTKLHVEDDFKNIQFPYKFRQSKVSNIKIIGFDDTFYFCDLDQPTYVFASHRDLEKIERWLNIDTVKTIRKIYTDNLNNKIAYLLQPTICVH